MRSGRGVRRAARKAWCLLAIAIAAGCATNPPAGTAPRFSTYLKPEIPPTLRVAADIRDRHDAAWQRLQAGDARGAGRAFADLVKRAPGFYPAEAGQGYASLADRQFKVAHQHFAAALAVNERYLSALLGEADAQLGLKNDLAALTALDVALKIDPSRESARSRADVLRLRIVQAQIEEARRDRDAGRLEEAQAGLELALQAIPGSAVLLRELAIVETARGTLDPAEAHARRAVLIDAGDPEAQAVLGGVLEAKGRYRDAADAYARAVAIDPRPAWRDRAESLRAKAAAVSIPPEYRAIPNAATVTRAQVAAMIGLRLTDLIGRAPKKVTVVATDVRTHWAAAWIVPVTQAGVMDVFPNHTFQPGTLVKRSDLAQIVVQLLALASKRPEDLARWRAARPDFADVAASHLAYGAASLAVAAGAISAEQGRFWPNRAASGQELVTAIARIEQLAGR